jgi:osmotically inducible protein OsmC
VDAGRARTWAPSVGCARNDRWYAGAMNVLYTAKARATGGRDGRATSADGHPDLLLKPPPAMGGPSDQPEATNPEELFALGYGACFLSALSLIARQQKISAKNFAIDTAVSLQEDGGAFGIAVELHGDLPDVDREKAAELMRTAHTVCPYSKATQGNIEVKLMLDGEQL